MKTVMLDDRINTRAKEKEFIVFDHMTRGYGNDEMRSQRSKQFLKQVYELGKNFQKSLGSHFSL
jgi:NAD(P)H dehydrogenase (quinone)